MRFLAMCLFVFALVGDVAGQDMELYCPAHNTRIDSGNCPTCVAEARGRAGRVANDASRYRGADPTLSSSYRPKPPTTVDKGITDRLKECKKRKSKLIRQREVWRVALEKFQKGDTTWKQELQYFAEDSQVAKIHALRASASALLGVAGPVEQIIAGHKTSAKAVFKVVQDLSPELKRVRALAQQAAKHSGDPKARQALRILDEIQEELDAALRSEVGLWKFYRNLHTHADRFLKASNYLEGADSMAAKQELSMAFKFAQDLAADFVVELGQEALVKRGSELAARSVGLGKFLVDYSYASTRFYIAWVHVDKILNTIDDRNEVIADMGGRIVKLTDTIGSLKGEQQRLEGVSKADQPTKKAFLDKLQASRTREYQLISETYRNVTGIRAPGRPIFDK